MNAATTALVRTLKDESQDFEWYPTTTEILDAVKADIAHMCDELNRYRGYDAAGVSVLDIGAGDGRALLHLTKGDRYAIEISSVLRERMDNSICIVGTDFHHQTLIDKKVDVVFCNPPYSEFELWAVKVIREANATLAYLVIPERWQDNLGITKAIQARKAKVDVLSAFDFLSGDRSARAKVHVIRVQLRQGFARRDNYRGKEVDDPQDPFNLWFEETFQFNSGSRADGLSANEKQQARDSLVPGQDYVQRLVELYEREMAELFATYRKFESIDTDLLREVGVSADTVKRSLRQRIAGLKDVYWNTFFSVFDRITSRLITSNRRKMLDRITAHVSLDFTVDNAYAMAIWAIKNANEYYDSQIIEVFERMVGDANVQAYKSNAATFQQERWRFARSYRHRDNAEKPTHFKLDYRIVLEYTGGIATSEYGWERDRCNGLTERAVEYLQDLCTVACNLGFETTDSPLRMEKWVSGAARLFHAVHNGKRVELMRVRAFKNGNIHIQFNQSFLLRLNVEFGRLKGWLKNKHQAAEELNAKPEQVAEAFGSNLQLAPSAGTLLLTGSC